MDLPEYRDPGSCSQQLDYDPWLVLLAITKKGMLTHRQYKALKG